MLIIFSFQPVIDFIVEFLRQKYAQRSFLKTKAGAHAHHVHTSKCAHKKYDYQEFVSLHAGPQYLIYYKCANTNMMVFITIFFGSALPILYIITCWSILCQYVFERLTLAYFYRLPPKFNDQLTLLNIKLMQLATIPSLLLTFWLYGNNQMFGNRIDSFTNEDEVTLSHHTFHETLKTGWESRALLVTAFLIFLYLFVEVAIEIFGDEDQM